MPERIVIIAEIADGAALPVTDELMALAWEINPPIIEIIALGRAVGPAAQALADRTGLAVLAVELDQPYSSALWKDVLAQMIPPRRPDLIIAAHTTRGQEYAPGLAARLGADCIGAVQGVVCTDGALVFSRAILGGKLLMDVTPRRALTVLTVQPGAFASHRMTPAAPGPVTTVHPAAGTQRIVNRGTSLPPEDDSVPLTEAEAIVAAGRGIGRPENLTLLHRLAACFKHAAVGGSRPVCDQGWLPYRCQVGLTGKTVSPKLYIACGISGAPQHVAGMRTAQLIFAINSDPNAAIFRVADYGIVADLAEFIPLLLAEHDQS